ncbi:phosphate signaling complex protein PhoU [Halorhabdus sp. CUG00001]|uniref:phosphate signaling complex protein PhoU n=1 Tax=Halorhabdus sp. CUG00001 TaxID=2600297 RepID=UPI00131BB0F5|nr:phosphate signaling complex protein PhoU [Halorhabdus sp. CUG00001]
MAREAYREALADLRTAVVEMGELVLDRLETALQALTAGEPQQAREVIDGDEEINRRYLAIESDCVDLFALEQPVAGDLRFVAASFKITTDLERVGDLATNLARYALSSRREQLPDLEIEAIGERAHTLLADALTAYEGEDATACRTIAERDDDIDTLCQRASERLVRDLLERDPAIDAWTLEPLLDEIASVLLTIRDLERVGDHAVNVAARTLYVLEGDPELIY